MSLEKSENGIRRASEFTWEKSAETTTKIYQDIVSKSAKKTPAGSPPLSSSPLNVYDFVQKVTQLVEAHKNKEALAFYDSYRTLYKEHLYLGKFDSLVGAMKVKAAAEDPGADS
jgi:hypothetical protein